MGLKQNRAIRFASPTPEHRCYVGGEPIDIPVNQAEYCLASGHTHCPLYMGLTVPTIADTPIPLLPAPQTGVRGWLASLPLRERRVYAGMIALLGALTVLLLFLLLQSVLTAPGGIEVAVPTAQPTQAAVVAPDATQPAPSALPSAVPPTPTALPRNTSTPQPTAPPPTSAILLLPTSIATTPTSSSVPASPVPASPVPVIPTSVPASPVPASPVPASPVPVIPTSVPASPVPASPVPASPVPVIPTPVPARPTTVPVPPTTVPATAAPTAVQVSREVVTLYFGDATGGLYVPVQRTITVENQQIARAAIQSMISGPRGSLTRLLLPETQVLGVKVQDGTATVNLDRRPTGGNDERGLNAIVLALTEFASIQRVQIQVNGSPLPINGAATSARPVVNPLNPGQLTSSVQSTSFLPLYFPAKAGNYDVRVIRMVPKTLDTAEATVRALLDGPGSYGYALRGVIPAGTELRGIKVERGVVLVDFTRPFADAQDRAAVTRTIAASLTTLPNVKGVVFLVEGTTIADVWGGEYGRVYGRAPINPE